MKTYWDLSEKERAALTAAEVEQYLAAELMSQGVLRVKPLELVAVEPLPAPTVTVYTAGAYAGHQSYGYATAVEAASALAGLIGIETVRLSGGWDGPSIQAVTAKLPEMSVHAERIYSREQLDTARALMARSAAAQTENKSRTEIHDKEVTENEKALAGLWDDWHECGRKANAMQRVIDTFAEYERTAGDKEVAARFLAKVFSAEQIKDASEWFGVHIPDPIVRPAEEHAA